MGFRSTVYLDCAASDTLPTGFVHLQGQAACNARNPRFGRQLWIVVVHLGGVFRYWAVGFLNLMLGSGFRLGSRFNSARVFPVFDVWSSRSSFVETKSVGISGFRVEC